MMKLFGKITRLILIGLLILVALGAATLVGINYYLAPQLPEVNSLRDVQFQVPLQVYTTDEQLIAEYGDKKRTPVTYPELPKQLVQAITSAEDDRFFEHPGVDYQGLLRAAYYLATTGQKAQGGSTITMQVARNFFLTKEKTYLRKLTEIFLSLKIERELSKEQILELYFNKIYFGNRAYGVASAAQVYYGKALNELDLAQVAMIAGLPKAPSRYNPLANTERAVIRRNYVLKRMHQLKHISTQEYELARSQPSTAKLHRSDLDLDAPYIGEMVRAHMYDLYGEKAYTNGYKVYATVESAMQKGADAALRKNLLAYDQRHGFRGPIKNITIEYDEENNINTPKLQQTLRNFPIVAGLTPGIVIGLEDQSAQIQTRTTTITIPWQGLSWAKRYIEVNRQGPEPKTTKDILELGDLIYIRPLESTEEPNQWRLTQIPLVTGAIVSIDPNNGSLKALSGGFDFFYSKFNRATQAKRQPGSSFKPFVYSAALEKGFTPASLINDAPVVFDDPGLEASWRPENYSGKFYGPTRLRQALIKSRNLVSIRLLQSVGIKYAINHVSQFGFDAEVLPKDLSLSLGSAAVTPYELASAYTTFANGGYKVEPYFIERIEDHKGEIIFQADPYVVCHECDPSQPTDSIQQTDEMDIDAALSVSAEDIAPAPKLAPRVISEQNVYQITSMMRDVVNRGTGRRALALKRKDLSGKTGTTNDQRDAWFAGFNGNLVTISWTGFDDAQPLGNKETGSSAALPIWVDYMRVAMQGKAETPLTQPAGMITVKIDPETGLLASGQQENAIFETFRQAYAPQERAPDIDDSVTNHQDSSTPDNANDSGSQLLF